MKRFVYTLMACVALAALPVLAQKAPPAKGGDYQVGDRLAPAAKGAAAQYRQITWDDLIPPDWRPDDLFKDFDLGSMTDRDPRAAELMQKLREAWDRAPVIERMNGQRVRIPGFVVALENEGEQIREFLPEEQRFMLYLRCADEKELTVEVDRPEVKERLALAPRLDQANVAPIALCDCKVE